jgi:hypothetical protein
VTTARKRSKFAVHFFTEGDGFVVRGTLDPHAALALAVAQFGEGEEYLYEDMLAGVAPPRPGIEPDDYEIDPDAVAAMADRCHEWIATARPGLYRMNVASAVDEDCYHVSWWFAWASQRGPGVWQGVLFQ